MNTIYNPFKLEEKVIPPYQLDASILMPRDVWITDQRQIYGTERMK